MGSLEEYNILRVIGKGSYGEVHLIQHKKEKKQYVIKKLALLKASKRERKAAELEAKLLSKLRHPNIVSYKDSFEGNDGFLYIVMGFAEGGDLYTKLREHREKKDYLSEVQVVRWFIQICMAIQYLHQRHILHRDLKTQNIFLTKTKMIKVGDLGIAKVLEGATDMATTLIGTPYYMSPELFSNKPYNYKSDIWALGCCAFEIMTLRHAFNAKDMNSLVYKILQRKIPKLPDLYSAELCELIKGMLHQTAEKRPSVNKILRNSFIKQHIQLFLDESSKSRRNANSSKVASNRIKGRDSLKSNEVQTTSSSGHHSQSPQSSTDSPLPNNNQQKPAAAPATTSDDTKNNSNNQKQQNLPTTTDQSATTTTTPNNPQQPSTTNKQNGINNNNNHRKQPQTTTAKSKLSPSEVRQIYDEAPSRQQRNERYRIINNNISNNNNRKEVKHVTKRTEDVIKSSNKPDVRRVGSGGGDVIQLPIASREPEKRSLPKLPNSNSGGGKQTSSGNNKEQEISDGNNLASSSESISSVISTASTASKTSSARERRRQRHRIAGHKVAQVRPSSQDSDRSKSAGSNGGGGDNITTNRSNNNNNNNNNKKETRRKPSKYSPAAGDAGMEHRETASPSSDENKNEGNGKNGGKEEENQFYSLLHTTLKLSEDDEPSPPISPVNEEEDDGEKRLSPVPELSESSTSSVLAAATKNPPQKAPKKLNTPDATETRVRFPSNVVNKPQQNPNPVPFRNKVISQATLASTGRLMDRIVALRKDCIRGLGVQLLHRAYELLDEEKDEDRLQDQLIALLGKPRFYQWAGKIWQLKFCEESIFNHCGSITAI